jgi:predicted amidophosphoribosyltransferase
VLDVLLPQRCLVCSMPGRQVCAACTSALRRIAPPACACCGAPTSWPVGRCVECAGRRLGFVRARAAVEYDAPVRCIVGAWKERGLRRLAAWAAAVVAETLEPPDDPLTFVPPDPERRLRRGHHPAEALARELARTWGIAVEPLLVRVRGSPRLRQRELTRAQRRGNVAAAFAACGGAVPRRVVLVDDVYTTGSTATAATLALRKAGCLEVEVVTFARTIRIR